ncbi:MerR family transcriptional regulator [Bradyrhizobium sp. UFLA03-84]|uniref:MerR family transcriptional regulator n=1 Tax=Bradyrhizobium sp. UFLA03-84 TaxID=418599 RepID=UPI0018E9D2A0|nr:MerR family transcriptional regulator [Bradyrhizobium sp. UFLA03-84]
MMDARTTQAPSALHIGEIARRSGRSVHTIRWYETQGLMPGVVRDRGRRRVYSDYHIGWLDLMERLRLTGMSIRQLREYTTLVKQGSASLPKRRALLAAHQLRVHAMIAKWTEALTLVDAKVEFYDEWMAGGRRPTISPQQRARAMRSVSKA